MKREETKTFQHKDQQEMFRVIRQQIRMFVPVMLRWFCCGVCELSLSKSIIVNIAWKNKEEIEIFILSLLMILWHSMKGV